MDTKEEMKKVLLKVCKRINNAELESIKILQSQPLCNFRGIVRASKNTKDPNPLSSMQVTMSRKFPISVDAERAREKGMPKDLLHEPDCHQYGRVLAKREALTWYMDCAQVPDDETKKAIDILFKEQREDVKRFLSFSWDNAYISIGHVALVRDRIPLRDVEVHIPKYARTQYLLAALLPHYVLDWENINPIIMKSFKDLMELKTTNKISIASQIAVLDSALEPKWRVLPILPDMDRDKNRIRHVFCSNQWIVKGYTDKSEKSKQSFIDQTLSLLGEACAHIIYRGVNPSKVASLVSICKVYHQNVTDALKNFASRETIYIKLLKCLVEMEITKESTVGEIIFCPSKGDVVQVHKENASGTPYTLYEGQEIVYFKHHEYRGSFSHSGEHISIIDMPDMDLEIAAHIIGCIAAYCRYDFMKTKGRNLMQMQGEVLKSVSLRPWKFLGSEKQEWMSRTTKKWRIVNEASYIPPPLYRAKVLMTKGFLKLHFKGGFNVRVHAPMFKRISGEIQNATEYLIDYLPPGKELEQRYYFFVSNGEMLIERLRRYDYNWGNSSIMLGIPVVKRMDIASTCRSVLSRLICLPKDKIPSINLLAVFYLFSYSDYTCPLQPQKGCHEFVWNGSVAIDFRFTKGFFKMENDEMVVNGNIFQNTKHADPEERLKLLFPGFDIIPRSDAKGLRMLSASFSRSTTWDSDVRYGIMIGSDVFEIKRNIIREVEIAKTMRRALQPKTVDEILQELGIQEEESTEPCSFITEDYDDWNNMSDNDDDYVDF